MSEINHNDPATTATNIDHTATTIATDISTTSTFDAITSLTPWTTNNSTTKKSYAVPDFAEVWLYFSPFLLLIGVVGNVLVVVVMRRRRLRRTTTSVYLIALAIADTAALLTRIPPEFFKFAGVGTFSTINEWTCRLEKFSFYTFSDIAIWILVMFTVDRFIAVSLPFYKQKISFPRRAMHIIAVIIIIMILKNFHVFWTRGREYKADGSLKKVCGRPAHIFEQYIRPWIAFTFITLLPFITIVFCNISITVCLVRTTRRMQGLKVTRRSTSSKSISSLVRLTSGTLHNNSHNSNNSSNKNNSFVDKTASTKIRSKSPSGMTQTTLMCLSTSIAFLICVSPSIILTLGRVRWQNHPDSALPFTIARSVNYQLSILNHAINFFLYCLTGQRFRHELRDAMKELLKSFKSCCRGQGKVSLKRHQLKSTSVRRFSFDSQSNSGNSVSGRKLEKVVEEDF